MGMEREMSCWEWVVSSLSAVWCCWANRKRLSPDLDRAKRAGQPETGVCDTDMRVRERERD
jgi:hypothetical protein